MSFLIWRKQVIFVNNLTIEETKELIQSEIDEYLKMTMVIVKLVNYNVTLVGEVNKPGQYKVYQDRINIFEMISMAGDLTVYAKRNDICPAPPRENENHPTP